MKSSQPTKKADMDDLKDLQKQIADLQARADAVIQRNREAILVEVKDKIETYGLTAEECGFQSVVTVVKATKKASKTTLPPKYKNEATGDTWHGGRGAKPKWVKEVEAKGESIESYLIK